MQFFHIGGDEILVGSDEAWASCYNGTEKAKEILEYLSVNGFDRADQESFYGLWQNYTRRVANLATRAFSNHTRNVGVGLRRGLEKIHIWGGAGEDSTGVMYNLMTRSDVTSLLPPESFNIQVWDTVNGSISPHLISLGYQIVLSNTDYVYLDCGSAGWAHPGG